MDQKLKPVVLALGLLVFVGLNLWALSALHSAARIHAEFDWDGRHWVVSESAELPLQPGDRVLSIGGLAASHGTLLLDNSGFTSRGEFLAWLESKAGLHQQLGGASVAIGVERGTERLELGAPLYRHSWSFLKDRASIHWLVSVVFFLVGWATYLRPGANRQAFWFYLMCLSMSLVYLTNLTSLLAGLSLDPRLFKVVNVLNVSSFVFAPALLLHFSLLMPRSRVRPWLLLSIYGPSVFVIATLSLGGGAILVPLLFLGSLLAIGQGAFSYRGSVERQQMKWVGVGFLLGIGPWFVLNGLPLLIWGERLVPDTLPGACLVFIPIFMAVAIHRYRLFDVGTFLEGTLAYLLCLSLLLGCEALLLVWLGESAALEQPYLLSLALLLGLYGPLRDRLARLLGRLFRRRELSDREVRNTLKAEITVVTAEGILAGLERAVQRLWEPESIVSVVAEGRTTGAHLEMSEVATVLLVVAPELALRCGPLPRGRYYSAQVLTQLTWLAEESALYYRAAVLYEQANDEKKRRLDERERLLSDLHDGVGSTLANIRLLSTQANVADLAGDALFELQTVLYDGPEYTVERAQFLAELRQYCCRLFDDGPIELNFLVAGERDGLLSRALALSLFRLIREALSNVLKHSQAGTVWIELELGASLHLCLRDDGRGFEAVATGRGLGGMRQRVAALGGEMTLISREGTHIEVTLPI